MRRPSLPNALRDPRGVLRSPWAGAVLCLALIVGGALVWFRPFLTSPRPPFSEVPAPPPLNVISQFPVSPRQPACMSSVGIESDSRLVQFELHPTAPTASTPAVQVALSSPGYRASATVARGFPGGVTTVPVTPPPRAAIVTVCFSTHGHGTALLGGSTEGRTTTRSQLTLAGRPVPGQITLAFYEAGSKSLLDRLGTIFSRAANMTGQIVPAWLVWALALTIALGLPGGLCRALLGALREDVGALHEDEAGSR